jgi:hypothetical protein
VRVAIPHSTAVSGRIAAITTFSGRLWPTGKAYSQRHTGQARQALSSSKVIAGFALRKGLMTR